MRGLTSSAQNTNAHSEEHKVVIGKIVGEFKGTSTELTSSVNDARVETKTLSEQNTVLRGELGNAFAEQTGKIAGVRDEMSKWAADHKVDILRLLQQGGGGNGGDQSRSGSDHGAGGKGPTIDKKELSVWKLPDQVTKQEFRHWLDAVDTYLAAAQNLRRTSSRP